MRKTTRKGGGVTTAGALDERESLEPSRDVPALPECDCQRAARRVGPGRLEALREMRAGLIAAIEGMPGVRDCTVILDGRGGATIHVGVIGDGSAFLAHGLRIRLDADPDC